MRAMFRLSRLPDGPTQVRLQNRLEAHLGVRSALLDPQSRTLYVDYDPPHTSDAAIEKLIRACGLTMESSWSEPDDSIAS